MPTHWLDELTESQQWESYGLWADAKAQLDEPIMPFSEWLEMERSIEPDGARGR